MSGEVEVEGGGRRRDGHHDTFIHLATTARGNPRNKREQCDNLLYLTSFCNPL